MYVFGEGVRHLAWHATWQSWWWRWWGTTAGPEPLMHARASV